MNETATSKAMNRKKNSRKESIWDVIRTIIWAVGIALVIRTFAYEPFSIPSGSMVPTLLVGDYLFVSKFSYGYSRFSLPISFNLSSLPKRVMFSEPKRGDVAVFSLPRNNNIDYIKRIVGLPGDKIQVRHGILHINGKPVKRERIEDYITVDSYGHTVPVAQYIETLPNGRQYRTLEVHDDQSIVDNTPVYKVPEGHYFGMGDNRDNSTDSRFLDDVGYIPRENLIGRAEFLFFSRKENTAFWEIWKWPWSLRFYRFFNSVR